MLPGVLMGFWPKGYKSCFFLSFDYDASSAETWKTPDDLSSLSKGRYAPRVAVPRILDMLDRLEIKTTFFTPGWTCDNHPDSLADIISHGHEIGAHSYAHEKMTDLSSEKETEVWEKSMAALERIGVKPQGYRAPYWMFGERSISNMQRLGFKYSSNMMDFDMPYMLEHNGKPTGLVELPVEWLTDDWPHFEMDRSAPETVYQLWKPEWEAIHEAALYFGLTCHPECIGKLSRLKMLEKLVTEAKAGGDVWFPTGKELAEWTRKKLK
jgi:peptidoglycan/xylan/chitin deacetylase (PgdA/CDA1 family)